MAALFSSTLGTCTMRYNRSGMWRVVSLALLVGCNGAAGGVDAGLAPADAQGTDSLACTPFAARTCFEGDAYWQDSCGQRGDLADECQSPTTCLDSTSKCCLPGVTGNFQGYSNGARVRTFIEPGQTGVTFTIDVAQASTGRLGMLQAVGLQADVRGGPLVNNEEVGLDLSTYTDIGGINGPVVYFAQAGLNDLGLAEAGPGASVLLGGAGGIAIFSPLNWTSGGSYRLRLATEQSGGDYFWAAYVMPSGQPEVLVGRFNLGTTAPDLDPTATQLHSAALANQGPVAYADIPILEVSFSEPDISPGGFNSAVIDYQAQANTDATYDPQNRQVRITSGGDTPRCGPEEAVFTGP